MGNIQPLQKAEARVLGVLIEKSMTTPEGYPMSLNALLNGCNQKSNRSPLTAFDEQTVTEAVRDLRMNRLAVEVNNRSARVIKYKHKAEERLEVDKPSAAILAELLLRGPQTPGELRGRASRMTPIASLEDLNRLLNQLIDRQLVVQLSPLSGSRAVRYMQLLAPGLHEPGSAPSGGRPGAGAGDSGSKEPDQGPSAGELPESTEGPSRSRVPSAPPAAATIPLPDGDLSIRVAALEDQMASLASLVAQLRRRMGPPVDQ